MERVCQGAKGILAVAASLGIVSAAIFAAAPKDAAPPLVILAPWTDEPFPSIALANPDLAACLVMSPAWWELVGPPATLPSAALADDVADRLRAALGSAVPLQLTVHVAAVSQGVPKAIARHTTALLLVPQKPPPAATQLAEVVAQAVVTARLATAPPDPRCSEPLLALAEATVHAGMTTLAALPANLRPLGEWLDSEVAARALTEEVAAALDGRAPWANRRVRLAQLARPSGSAPAFGQAAARLLEAAGEPSRFLARPLGLLLAWREAKGDPWPTMPRVLRRALADPRGAGLARSAAAQPDAELALAPVSRAAEAGEYSAALADPTTPLRLRLRAAAGVRGAGSGAVCQWFQPGELPAGALTGCREEGETGSFVYARPGRGDTFEILARSPTGAEVPLVLWPRWVLFPVGLGGGEELAFVDAEGIWSVALDGTRPPRRLAAGSYRYLAVSPNGRRLAAVSWPAGQVVRLDGSTATLQVDGRGGIAWLTDEVLLASDGTALALAAGSDVRASHLDIPATRALAAHGGTVVALAGDPPSRSLLRIFLAERRLEQLAATVPPTVGLAVSEDGTVVGGGAGLWLWRGGSTVEVIGVGLTPGPVR